MYSNHMSNIQQSRMITIRDCTDTDTWSNWVKQVMSACFSFCAHWAVDKVLLHSSQFLTCWASTLWPSCTVFILTGQYCSFTTLNNYNSSITKKLASNFLIIIMNLNRIYSVSIYYSYSSRLSYPIWASRSLFSLDPHISLTWFQDILRLGVWGEQG